MNSFATKLEDGRRARAGETILPAFKKGAFHSRACHVFAPQEWKHLRSSEPIWKVNCDHCGISSYWLNFDKSSQPAKPIYPGTSSAPLPHPDMPDDVREDYNEAGTILALSPRGAGAILRLALQKLMPHLNQKGKDLDADIGALVKAGLDPEVQQALDAMRVIGNNAVHPPEMDLRDDADTVGALFGLINYIIEDRISRPKKLATMYAGLPQGARDAIGSATPFPLRVAKFYESHLARRA